MSAQKKRGQTFAAPVLPNPGDALAKLGLGSARVKRTARSIALALGHTLPIGITCFVFSRDEESWIQVERLDAAAIRLTERSSAFFLVDEAIVSRAVVESES